MTANLELIDYSLLFESEPEWVHEMGWFYGARFTIERGGDRLVVTVAPDEQEFYLEWWQASRCLMKVKLVMVSSWFVQQGSGKECLIVKAAGEREILCVVAVKPEISVTLEAMW